MSSAMLFVRRGESVVYFEEAVDVSRTLPWIERRNASGRPHLTLFILTLRARALAHLRALLEDPERLVNERNA